MREGNSNTPFPYSRTQHPRAIFPGNARLGIDSFACSGWEVQKRATMGRDVDEETIWRLRGNGSLRGPFAPPNVDQPSDYACPGSCASFLGVPKSRQSAKPSNINHPVERPMGARRCISAGVIGQLGYAILSFLTGSGEGAGDGRDAWGLAGEGARGPLPCRWSSILPGLGVNSAFGQSASMLSSLADGSSKRKSISSK